MCRHSDIQIWLVQAQSCSNYTTEATCTAKQVPYSGLATVVNATIEFTVTLNAADVANFTQALTQALALRCLADLFTQPESQANLCQVTAAIMMTHCCTPVAP